MENKLSKGYQTEEVLRRYFIRSGHFTLRGVPFVYQGFEVTDIDIWAYDRPSPVSRQRIIVDCKNKTTPKAIERIFWTKGLKEVLGVEQAIVATTDKRIEVAEFGREHGVVILDGNFLTRLEKSTESFASRMTEEQFIDALATYRPVKEGGDWKARIKAAKRPFATGLSFNALNGWINEGHFFAEQVHLVPTHKQQACRALYLLLSFISIGFDFVLKDFTFSETAIRFSYVDEGLRHGSPGAASTNQVLRLAMGLIEHYVPESKVVANKVKDRLTRDLDTLATRMLAEHVCKPSVAQELFAVAKEFEASAYKSEFVSPKNLSNPTKGLLLLFMDFWGFDRTKFLETFEQDMTVQPVQPVPPIPPTQEALLTVAPEAVEAEMNEPSVKALEQPLEQTSLPGLDQTNLPK